METPRRRSTVRSNDRRRRRRRFFDVARPALPDLLVHELHDHLESAIGRGRAGLAHDEALSLAVEELEIDDAAGLPVCGDEAIQMRPRMRLVVGALEIEHGRELHLLAP